MKPVCQQSLKHDPNLLHGWRRALCRLANNLEELPVGQFAGRHRPTRSAGKLKVVEVIRELNKVVQCGVLRIKRVSAHTNANGPVVASPGLRLDRGRVK